MPNAGVEGYDMHNLPHGIWAILLPPLSLRKRSKPKGSGKKDKKAGKHGKGKKGRKRGKR